MQHVPYYMLSYLFGFTVFQLNTIDFCIGLWSEVALYSVSIQQRAGDGYERHFAVKSTELTSSSC